MSVSLKITGFSIAFGAALIAAGASAAGADVWRTSDRMGEPSKYGENFKHYDHVNPNAPKGGTLNSVVSGTFDSFNPFIAIGTPAAGLNYQGGLLYDPLMAKSLDEATTSHALIADAFKYPEDFSSATYRLNANAKWHDGQPITADDVIWSFNTLKKESPDYGSYFGNVTEAVKVGEREVEFRFDQKGNRELPQIMGDLIVLPKHWWEGTDARGNKRDISRPTLEAPLGSGPYKIESFKPGSEIIWSRVPDYWAADLGVNVGRNNFDRRRYSYFLDENAEWQAFTKGGYEDIRPENVPNKWMTQYDFPALKAGDVIKQEFPDTSGSPMQAFVMNMRRPQFQDRRVRQALTIAYDFESYNRKTAFGLNTRTDSYFEGQELASSGLPQGAELEILEQYKDKLQAELFTQEFKLPVYDTPQAERTHLREAVKLLGEAGWVIKGGKLVNAETGQQFKAEMLITGDYQEIIAQPFIDSLRKIGIDATLRQVDVSQYIGRRNNFDFDMILGIMSQSQSPGNEQRNFWASAAADQAGSNNFMGIKDPVIDALTERVIFAKNREDQITATHALDRALLWGYYVVPQYHRPKIWLAYWNKFGIPATQPSVIGVDIDAFWIDPEKEKALAAKYRGDN